MPEFSRKTLHNSLRQQLEISTNKEIPNNLLNLKAKKVTQEEHYQREIS